MSYVPYPYEQIHSTRYVFTSDGVRKIRKVVGFTPLGIGNIINMGFGDQLPDGTIDDQADSNNGDITKVLATVIDIIKHFTTRHPKAVIYFRGSTPDRTKLYG